eukprot:2981416-Rhodomonas_salina.2
MSHRPGPRRPVRRNSRPPAHTCHQATAPRFTKPLVSHSTSTHNTTPAQRVSDRHGLCARRSHRSALRNRTTRTCLPSSSPPTCPCKALPTSCRARGRTRTASHFSRTGPARASTRPPRSRAAQTAPAKQAAQ